MKRLFCSLLVAVACLTPAAAQDTVEMDRLATDQRQVAEQVRRLDNLLGVLEQRDRDDGREARAELLANAREQLRSAEGSDLAGALEGVASALGRQQTGSALEAQAEAITLLQELLDFLVRSRQREMEQQRVADLEEWQKGLEDLAARQQELMDRAQEIEDREQESGETDEAAREELAEDQQELADDIEAFNDEQARKGMSSENTEKAEDAAEEAAEELQPPSSAEQQPSGEPQEMDAAQQKQQEAKDALEQQEQEIEQELESREDAAKRQILLDVAEEAAKLLEQHLGLVTEMRTIAAEAEDGRLPRSARGKLRRTAAGEREIAEAASELLLTIDEYGADSFPYFLSELQRDHERLASQVGPPRYRLQESTLQLADDLSNGWNDLVEAIRIEEERLRRRMEGEEEPSAGGGQPGEEEDPPLVQFTAELQLLKRMQATVTNRLERLHLRLEVYEKAGVEADPLDIAELLLLQERQQDLALHFESIVQRALGGEEPVESEDA